MPSSTLSPSASLKGAKKTMAPNTPNPKPNNRFFWIYLILVAGIFGINYLVNVGSPAEVQWRDVRTKILPQGDVSKIVIITNRKIVEVFVKPDHLDNYKDLMQGKKTSPSHLGPHFYFIIGDIQTFQTQLAQAQEHLAEGIRVEPQFEERSDYFGHLMGWLTPIIIILTIYFLFARKAGGVANGIFSVGKSKAQLFDKDSKVKITFADVAGLEEAKVEVMEIVDFLKNPKRYTDLGGKIPKGALLVGPPGTGKTLLAKAVAGEADVPFFSLSGSDFVEMFVGVGASRVRDLFQQAKSKAPCIIFIDEIDAVGRARNKNMNFGVNDERESTLNQLLTEMDGFGSNSGVIILAATNRADILDRALLRAGRFDRQIHVDLPDLKERAAIFNVHLRGLKLIKDLDIDFLAKQTPGFSGADIANVCNEAALIAARKNKAMVEKQDFLDAVDRIIGGLEKKNKIVSLKEKRTIAYHEAGHATVSWMLEYANPLVKVTIIPRGRSLGAAWYLPEERQITTYEQMLHEMAATLGGRASEELNFGAISTGALNDLERVTKQAYSMIAYFGMSDKLRNLSYYDSTGQSEYAFNRPYSEKTSEMIDEEVQALVDAAYKLAKQTLAKHKEGLEKLANLLLEREVIFTENVEEIFGKRPKEDDLTAKPKRKTRAKKGTSEETAEAVDNENNTENTETTETKEDKEKTNSNEISLFA